MSTHATKKRRPALTLFYVCALVVQLVLPGFSPTANYAAANSNVGASLVLGYCGDGIVNGEEQCDDGNNVNTDACHNDCTKHFSCQFNLDVALVMDRSGSMGDTSRCDWWQLKCKNKPSCSLGYEWVKNTTYNQTESWCQAKNQSAPHQSVFVAYNPTKIAAAKTTANEFLDLLGTGDQSALVSFANDATLDKQLSNDHAATKTTINSLITLGATDIGDALNLANGELTSNRINPKAEQIIILLTDGMANKPSGPGYGEYPADVDYALDKASEAASHGIKIFTIGLGSDINNVMLEEMATTTGGKYYSAPSADDLTDIYDQIASDVCRYGSFSGCKYHDQNKDGLIDPGEPTLPGWEIVLEKDGQLETKITGPDGCFRFDGVPLGTYTMYEAGKPGVIYEQTLPLPAAYAISLTGAYDLTGYDFGNYLPTCGNHTIDTGYSGYTDEECDDGNNINTDSCTNNCRLPVCGDGLVSLTEACDDGNQNNDDGCLNNCTLPTCGDGYLWTSQELCDAGMNNGQVCTPAYGSNCTYCSDICTPVTLSGPYCGDGTKNGPEQCDGTDGVPAHYVCSPACYLNYVPYCGDGIKNGTEQCDDGNTNNEDACLNSCLTATCGDGFTNPATEQCDDGNNIDTDGCANSCQLPVCGDGLVSLTEVCDDGNQNNSDACLNDCTLPTCGDGYLWAGEELCDNGFTNGQVCVPPYAGQCSYCSLACQPVNLSGPYCGDHIKNGPEECDGTDGLSEHYECSPDCQLIYQPYCGDGLVNQASEQCDDGNQNNDDNCQNNCSVPSLCDFNLDLVLVMDRSGSMGDTSRCDWWQLKCKNKPSCSLGYEWVKNTTYNQTESWCQAKNQSAPHQSSWVAYTPVKLPASKDTANNFLSLLSLSDQSGLVSFANDSVLNKTLSNDHPATKTAVNNLTALGATNIGDALKLATGELTSPRINPTAKQIIILLTDGKANKPLGPGYDEYAPDVAYALSEAAIAGSHGIKIFTIGLDSEINALTLEQIASLTGGEYYFAPTAADLETVFDQLKAGVCQSGPHCGDGIKNNTEECDGTDGLGLHQTCSATCTLITEPFCGDGIKNGAEECDGTDGVGAHQSCSDTCALTDNFYCGDGQINNAEACDDGNTLENDGCSSACALEYATVKAVKIVCPLESDLPDWSDTSENINESTVNDFLIDNPACHLEPNWSFQWVYNSGASNPGDNTGAADLPWQTFGPTDATGLAETQILLNGATLWFREVMAPGYLPFTGVGGDSVSAEFYCHTDVSQFDNQDSIASPQANTTYYCVAFNVPIANPVCLDLDADGFGTGADLSACAHPEPDCADSDANVFPGATEICDDGLDNDCDGDADSTDSQCLPPAPGLGDVVINEIAWMGTANSTADEWLELRNLLNQDIDLTGWTLNAADGTPAITLSGTLASLGYFLLERTDDTTVPSIAADQIYSGALSDTGETLVLKNTSDLTIDTVNGIPWPAGDNPANLTMERDSVGAWHNSASADGTPRAQNSL